jgi:lycopene cyclase domain-containing protein
MTYFTFLGIFLVIPIVLLLAAIYGTQGWQRLAKLSLGNQKTVLVVIAIHILLAVTWTTPWDNYLVATGVWYYNPELVTGIVLGYVPIEEYTFFVLQPIMTGLWLTLLLPYLYRQSASDSVNGTQFRIVATAVLGVLWVISVYLLFFGMRQYNYLGLELIWALPPIMLQVGFGADILRKQWRIVLFTIISATIYLALADSLAINEGTWAIDPAQSTGIMLGGILPVEELIFFLLTNTLVVFGTTLALASASQERVRAWFAVLKPQNAAS